jgi:hypothetical protein
VVGIGQPVDPVGVVANWNPGTAKALHPVWVKGL